MRIFPLKYSNKEWIKKAKKIHKNKYDYSKSKYTGSTKSITVICKIHGKFKLRSSHHLDGQGCKKCNIDKQRKSTLDFINDSEINHGKYYDYSLVNFNNIHEYVKIICPKHGLFKQRVVKHQSGQGCKKCNKGEVWNTQDFIKKSKIVHKNKFDYSEVKYSSTISKVRIFCRKCKSFFKQTPGSHLQGNGCAKCSGLIPITEEMFKEILRTTHNGKIILISNYINKKNKIKVKHTCGNEWSTTPNHLIRRNQGCKKCSIIKRTMTDQIFKKRLKEEHDGKIISLEKYKMSKIDIKVKCLKCLKVYKTQPRNVLRNGCHSCANRKSYKEFNKELRNASHGEIITLEKYKSTRNRVLVKHKCGYKWKAIPGDLIGKKAHGCPLCATSKGNKKIYHYLKNKKIQFITEKRFESCKYKIPLPFDFYIPDKKILIEYDGEQHFIPIDFWGGKKGLNERITKDKIKDLWAKKNGMKLIRIKYNENITRKVNELLKNYG